MPLKTRIILVGGFLGAGKTTLLWESARRLIQEGRRIGLITNDQAAGLVDTSFLQRTHGIVTEVSGSCFCCNFKGLLDAIAQINKDRQADIIIAEPVGSCTDLSATILQPLKFFFGEELWIAPLSVLVDPERLFDLLQGGTAGLHRSGAYILRKQLEEADIIVINKIDGLTQEAVEDLMKRAAQTWPNTTILAVSAKNGVGLGTWLDEVTNRNDAGKHMAEIDYDIYAEGEASLGWLNATYRLHGGAQDWNSFAENILKRLGRRFDDTNTAVGHIKLIIEVGESFIIGNLTGRIDTLVLRGTAGMGEEARMTLNARVQMDPGDLESIIREELAAECSGNIAATPMTLRCLSPARPEPTHRFNYVVNGR